MASEDFKQRMNEWVALKAQLASIRRDTQVLSKREKELRQIVMKHMKNSEIDTVNVKEKVKVDLKTTPGKRKSIPKAIVDIIQRGLTLYFGGDLARVEGAVNAILDSAPETPQKEVISVRGLSKLT
jgi:Family of unknown function (DUF5760)